MKVCVLDLGGTFIKAAMMDETAQIWGRWKTPSPTKDWESLAGALDAYIGGHLDEAEGIAISMPGRIDREKGIAHTGGTFQFIRDLPVKSILEEKYQLPVSVDNDGKCAASAENWLGALKDVANGLVYVIGTGVGGGIILNHQVVRGGHFAAGELSFPMVDMAGGTTFVNSAAAHLGIGALLHSYQKQTGCPEEIDGVEFFRRAQEKEQAALEVLHRFCRMTANYIYMLQAVLDVERVAVGGGISAQPLLFDVLNEELYRVFGGWDFPVASIRPQLVPCRYGNDANLIGALKNFLDQRYQERY